jgi:hypothetical protein
MDDNTAIIREAYYNPKTGFIGAENYTRNWRNSRFTPTRRDLAHRRLTSSKHAARPYSGFNDAESPRHHNPAHTNMGYLPMG